MEQFVTKMGWYTLWKGWRSYDKHGKNVPETYVMSRHIFAYENENSLLSEEQ